MQKRMVILSVLVLLLQKPCPGDSPSAGTMSFGYIQSKIKVLNYFTDDEISQMLKADYVEKYMDVVLDATKAEDVRVANLNLLLHYRSEETERKIVESISQNTENCWLFIRAVKFPIPHYELSDQMKSALKGCVDCYLKNFGTERFNRPELLEVSFLFCVFLIHHPIAEEIITNIDSKGIECLSLCFPSIAEITDEHLWLNLLGSRRVARRDKMIIMAKIISSSNRHLIDKMVYAGITSEDIDLQMSLMYAFYVFRGETLVDTSIEKEDGELPSYLAEYQGLLIKLINNPEFYRDPFVEMDLFDLVLFSGNEDILRAAAKNVDGMAGRKLKAKFYSDVSAFRARQMPIARIKEQELSQMRKDAKEREKRSREYIDSVKKQGLAH